MNFKILAVAALSTLIATVTMNQAHAEVKLHPIFTDNMVLQRDKPIPVWGTANPGEKVEVTFSIDWKKYPAIAPIARIASPERKRATADANGNWRVTLGTQRLVDSSSGSLSRYLNVKSQNEGGNSIEFKNIAIGDVYICSGQSNMEWPMHATNNAQAEIAAANFPNIRLLTVPKKIAGTPQKEFAAATSWQVCAPETIPGFSAVGYFFGRELNQKTNIPIGLINASWGGTVAEAWTSREALTPLDPAFRSRLQTLDNLVAQSQKGDAADLMKKWWRDNDAGLQNGNNWSAPDFDDAAWPEMKVPQVWEGTGIEEFKDFNGLVWFRKQIEIPADWQGKDLTLHMGAIDDNDTTFFNGVEIGSTSGGDAKRVYNVPGNLVQAGRATIAVRVFDGSQGGGLIGGETRRLEWKENPQNAIPLDGVWKLRASTPAAKLAPQPTDWQSNPNQTSVLFNGMIAPLTSFPARGAIWYQGESNADHPQVYRTLFPALIKDWRTQWNAKQDGSDFGFYFVQLANYMARVDQPVESGWAELRETQTAALSTPRTGMTTTIDVGEANDIHPRNKQDVGKRLALVALAKEYGQKAEDSGPMFSKMEKIADTNRVRVSFTHAAGLAVKNAPPILLAKVEGQDFPTLPLDFWAYAAIDRLAAAGIIEPYPVGNQNKKIPMTRYEFAVAIARLMENLIFDSGTPVPTKPLQLNTEQKNILFVLQKEFEPELRELGVRVGNLEDERISGTAPRVPKLPFSKDVAKKPTTAVAPAQKPKPLGEFVKGFAIRGEDGNWFWAQAHLDGDSVVLWSDEVLQPVAVRYAWANNPDVNLVNAEGLPAVPFRTDAP